MTARDQDSAVDEELCSGCVEATREPGHPFIADDFGFATASFAPPALRDFEAERDLDLRAGVGSATAALARSADFDAARDRLRAGVAWESLTTSTGVGGAVSVTTGSTAAFGLRPSPRAFANIERRSEYAGAVRG
jgi:hypothetical protein